MAELGGVNRQLSSEGTLNRCPEFARFTFWRSWFWSSRECTVIQLLGLGIGLRLVGVPPLKVVVSTRLAPWEAGADLVKVRSTES